MSDNKINILDAKNGWLSPQGEFFPLDHPYQHCDWCREKGYDTCHLKFTLCQLDQTKWIKLTGGEWIFILPYQLLPNRVQMDFIIRWHEYHDKPLNDSIKKLLELL